MSRQNQRYQSPFGAGRKQPDGLNSQNFLSGTGVQAALGGLGYGLNGRPLQNAVNGIPYLQPSIFASPKLATGRLNNEPPTPNAGNANGAGGTPGRQANNPTGGGRTGGGAAAPTATVGPSPKLGSTYGPPVRKTSGSFTANNTATASALAGIARMVETSARSVTTTGIGAAGNMAVGGGVAAGGGLNSLSVVGAGPGPRGGLSSTLPGSRPLTGNQTVNLLATAPAASRPATGNGTTLGRPVAAVPGLSFSVGSNQSMGSRGYQEDYRAIADTTSTPGLSSFTHVLLGAAVYDGHGGKQVSHWLASSYCLLNRCMEAVQLLVTSGGSPNDVAAVLDEVFMQCGSAAIAGRMTAGSCVAMALLVQAAGVPWVLSANVGDSRTIMVSWDDHEVGTRPEATQLSVDHKLGPAKLSEETRRVQAAGGTVIQLFGTWRIDGSLAVARAIGDCDFSRYLSCRPTVQCRQMSRRDRWIIIASDGLWDVMTNDEVAMFCKAQHQLAAAKLAEALVREAVRNRGSGDNTTVVAVRLHYAPPT